MTRRRCCCATSTLLGGRRTDVRLAQGTVVQLGALSRLPGEEVLDGGGAALSVGLADHHLHLLAMAAADASLDLRPAVAPDRAAVEAALAARRPGQHRLDPRRRLRRAGRPAHDSPTSTACSPTSRCASSIAAARCGC